MENIARVHRDEEQAKAREEEEERRMQEIDAERRIQILRGERPRSLSPPRPIAPSEEKQNEPHRRSEADLGASRHRKRRRIAGEDDTDRDMRFAREDAAMNNAKRDELLSSQHKRSDRDAHVSITDGAGHINLFTEDMSRDLRAHKNAEAEAEKSKKKRALEHQYTMRFSNAAGFKESVGKTPWYSSNTANEKETTDAPPSTDVWGNEDPMRQERDKARMNANDPLAAMRAGVRGLKKAQQERKQWQLQRLQELEPPRRTQSHDHNHRTRRRSRSQTSTNSLEGFSLESSSKKHGPDSRDDLERQSKHRHRHRHRHRHGDHR